VQPVIFVMMALLAYDFAKYAFQADSSSLGISFLPLIIAFVFFVMVQYLHMNPVWGILACLVLGALFLRG
jgi:chromate transporter